METEIIIEKVATTNKVPVPVSMMRTDASKAEARSGNMWHVLRSPTLLRRTLILCFAW